MSSDNNKPKSAVNNAVTITIGEPILRNGMTISTTTSQPYAADAAKKLMEIARDINNKPSS